MFRNAGELALDIDALFNASPNAYVLFDPSLVIAGCNDAYLKAVGRESRDQIVGQYLFDAFPSDPGSESYRLLKQSLDRVIATRQTDNIAIIPYDTSRPGEPPSMRYWSATHVPLFDKDGTFRFILQHTVDVTELQTLRQDRQRQGIEEAGVLHRAQEVQAQSQRLREMFAQAPGFVGILTGPDHVFQIANEAYRRLVGGRELVGKPVGEALPEVVEQGFIRLLDTVRESGEPYVGQGVRVLLQREADAPEEERFVDFVYQPLRDDHGAVYGIFVQGNDVTEQKHAEMHLSTVARESAHRVKNSLAIAQAVVSATLRDATDIAAARDVITARLAVLAATQPAMIDGDIPPSDIAAVVSTVMDLHRDIFGRIHVSGPSASIPQPAAEGLALILHELATNAIKYGALADLTGAIEIIWDVVDGRVALSWTERNGPLVRAPTTKGFGTRLIERALPPGPGNSVELTFPPQGVCCRISIGLVDDEDV